MKLKPPKYSKIFAGHDDGENWAQYAQVAWAEVIADLETSGLITASRLRSVDRYVRLLTEYEFRYSAISYQGPVIIAESSGNPYANIEWAALKNLSEQLNKLEENLLITPRTAKANVDQKKPETVLTKADKYLDRNATAH
jgi:phage terminase small subunit